MRAASRWQSGLQWFADPMKKRVATGWDRPLQGGIQRQYLRLLFEQTPFIRHFLLRHPSPPEY